jgi:glycosyltransferase involved in cell wall biosynthesis
MAPVVSVVIPTYNRPELLMERAVQSVIDQVFTDWECLVVGDGTDEVSVEAMLALCERDDRFRFTNLPHSDLPDDPSARWALAGVGPINHGLDEARGEFVSILCDDDEFLPNNLSDLLARARNQDADFVYGPSLTPGGQLYGSRADAFDIPQGSYILRRSLGYRADPACITRKRTWDGDFLERVLSGGHRVARCPITVHRFHPNLQSRDILGDWR